MQGYKPTCSTHAFHGGVTISKEVMSFIPISQRYVETIEWEPEGNV